jgi:type VI secretion system protein VasD
MTVLPDADRAARTALSPGRRRYASSLLSLCVLPCALSACSSGAKPTEAADMEERPIDIGLSADADVNIDIKGRGAPVMVRVYQLSSDVAFLDADYFSLQDQDKKTLGADLLAVDAFILRPGESRQFRRLAPAQARHVAVLAGYRDLPQANWREVRPLPSPAPTHWYRALASARRLRLDVRLAARGVTISEPGPSSKR